MLFFFTFLVTSVYTFKLIPIVIEGSLNKNFVGNVNNTVEFIIGYPNVQTDLPLRVYISSSNAQSEAPLLVVARQNKEVLSWQLPEDDNNVQFNVTARTLCNDHMRNKTAVNVSTPIISISTPCTTNVHFEVSVKQENDFFVQLNKEYTVSITPSQSRYYFYDFKFNTTFSDRGVHDSLNTVILEVYSDDLVCMIVSIQDAKCPAYDENHNVKFEGLWQTVNTRGGITIPKSKFPHGFFLVFVARVDDIECSGLTSFSNNNNLTILQDSEFRKVIKYEVKRSITYEDYVFAVLLTVFSLVFFYLIFGLGFACLCSRRMRAQRFGEQGNTNGEHPPQQQQQSGESEAGTIASTSNVDDVLPTTPTTIFAPDSSTAELYHAEGGDTCDTVSLDETEYDERIEHRRRRSLDRIICTQRVVYLSDMSRKDYRVLAKKSKTYLWHVLMVGVFYGLPVLQLAWTWQRLANDTGNQDLCYYNFLCAHPSGSPFGLNDFNHVFSNIAYVALGLLYLLVVWRHETTMTVGGAEAAGARNGEGGLRRVTPYNAAVAHGIPPHHGLCYALGAALCSEGVLSAAYHVCPSRSNFQFDTSFMYVTAVLCLLKLYQGRHPDVNASAYAAFAMLALAIVLGMIGIWEAGIRFWITFTIFHVLLGVWLSLHIYYMGSWRGLDRHLLTRFARAVWPRAGDSVMEGDTWLPLRIARFLLLLVANVCNWALAGYGLYHRERDFALHLLAIFMLNALLYFIFYILMKLIHRERINALPLCFLVLSLSCAAGALYCFRLNSISWALTPAESRRFNHDCVLLDFYDFHDMWHFLSAIGMFFMFLVLLLLDDDLKDTHRSKIPVF